MKLPWTWKIKELYINGSLRVVGINLYAVWNTFVYKVFKFFDTIRKDLTFKFYYPVIETTMKIYVKVQEIEIVDSVYITNDEIDAVLVTADGEIYVRKFKTF